MPPHPIDLPGDEPVLRSQLGGVGADQLVAAEAADQKLVVEPRAEPLRLGEAGERLLVGRLAHGPNIFGPTAGAALCGEVYLPLGTNGPG